MNIKMVVTDLDGTLLRDDKTINAYIIETFAELRAQGILIAFATARSPRSLWEYREQIQPGIVITNGGARALAGKETVMQVAIDLETTNAIISELKASAHVEQLCADTGENYYTNEGLDRSVWRGYENAIMTDFSEPLTAPALKIAPFSSNKAALATIAAKHEQVQLIHFTEDNWNQFQHINASKEAALAAVCKKLHINLSDVAAFGDDYNDIGMLSVVGVGVAMGNAIAEVKAVADCVCDTNENDGVAQWLRENMLKYT